MNKYKKLSVFLFTTILVIISAVFVGCNSKSDNYYPTGDGYYGNESSEDTAYAESEAVSERKIIYTINAQLTVEDVPESVSRANSLLKEGEWVQSSSEGISYSTIVYRVKTERLDEFMEGIKALGEVRSVQKESKDVSLDYYDSTLQKESLTKERERLSELLDKASSVSEFIQINERLTKIDKQLMELEGTLKNYDSLVEYSKVTVNFSKKGTAYVEPTFGETLAESYENGWEFAKKLIIGILVALPFIVVIGGIIVGVVFAVKAYRKKKGYVRFRNVAPNINRDAQPAAQPVRNGDDDSKPCNNEVPSVKEDSEDKPESECESNDDK